MRLSELISDKYLEWKGRKWNDGEKEVLPEEEGDFIYINADTGTGKTYFIFNVLAKQAEEEGERILYICNRVTLQNDAERLKEESGINSVDIVLYQTLEGVIARRNKTNDDFVDFSAQTLRYKTVYEQLKEYKYIVADEMHYFLEDAMFNRNTHYVYSYLLKPSPQVKVLISATGRFSKSVFDSRISSEHRYYLKANKEYINLTFYKDDRANGYDFPCYKIMDVLENHPDEKLVYFVSDIRRAKQLIKKIPGLKDNAYFMFSKSQSDTQRIRNLDCINKISEDKITFDRNMLITTSVLSNGVTLKDTEIKHIICDIEDVTTVIQCIGRKRPVDDSDSCNVYVRCPNYRCLMYQRKRAVDQLQMLQLFENGDEGREIYASEVGDFLDVRPDFFIIDWEDDCRLSVNLARKEKHLADTTISYYVEKYAKEGNDIYGEDYGFIKCFELLSGIEIRKDILRFVPEDSMEVEEAKQALLDFASEHIGVNILSNTDLDNTLNQLRKNAKMTWKEVNLYLAENMSCKVEKTSKRVMIKGVRHMVKIIKPVS